MSFIKRTIKDRVATGDNKFTNSGDATDLVLTPNPDSVTEAGTPVNADLLQRYENGLYAVGNRMDGGDSASNDANNNHANGVMGTKMTMRSDTTSNWETNNPVLAKGEIGYDSTNKKIKVGDGSTAWNSLKYVSLVDIKVGSDLPTSGGDYSSITTSNEFEVELVATSGNSFHLYHVFKQKYTTNHNLIQDNIKWCKIHGYFYTYSYQGSDQTKVNLIVYGCLSDGSGFTITGDYVTYYYNPSYSPSGYIAVYNASAGVVKQITKFIK